MSALSEARHELRDAQVGPWTVLEVLEWQATGGRGSARCRVSDENCRYSQVWIDLETREVSQ